MDSARDTAVQSEGGIEVDTFTTLHEVTAADAARFGRHVAKVEVLATVTDPGRPLAVLAAALGAAAAAYTALVGASWPVVALSFLATLLGWLALIWVLTCWAEARACRRAVASWHYQAASGATAVALRMLDRRTGGWLLQSMAASPRGRGAGSELMRRVCAQADHAGAVITLVAVTGRAAGWYSRFGFTPLRRTLPLGQWRMERQPSAHDPACTVL